MPKKSAQAPPKDVEKEEDDGDDVEKEEEEDPVAASKRERPEDTPSADEAYSDPKKQKTEEDEEELKTEVANEEPAPIPPSKEGTPFFSDNDVLSGRGGGTNVHPGNRTFRDLINNNRRHYLKARKNDKPGISRNIVRIIRERGGRFLKKDDKTGLWLEIGDDAAREKTSQALRQRAPEMRKLLFDAEREEASRAAEEQLRQQRAMMGMTGQGGGGEGGSSAAGMSQGLPGVPPGMMIPGMFPNPALFQAMAASAASSGKNGGTNMPNGQDAYSQMFSAALLGQGMPRFNNTSGV
jgi:hypothetical protein